MIYCTHVVSIDPTHKLMGMQVRSRAKILKLVSALFLCYVFFLTSSSGLIPKILPVTEACWQNAQTTPLFVNLSLRNFSTKEKAFNKNVI